MKVLKYETRKLLRPRSGKELIMTKTAVSCRNAVSMMGSSMFIFAQARFFAGLFCFTKTPSLSGA